MEYWYTRKAFVMNFLALGRRQQSTYEQACRREDYRDAYHVDPYVNLNKQSNEYTAGLERYANRIMVVGAVL